MYLSGKFKNTKAASNEALKDSKLSLKAKGLYAVIQSYICIPGFCLHKEYLRRAGKEGQKAFDSAWKELKSAGYLKMYRVPVNGHVTYEYELL